MAKPEKTKIDTKKMFILIANLRSAVECYEKSGRFLAANNSFKDLAEMFLPVPDPVQKVIIFRERHGDLYYDASTIELINLAFFNVIKTRKEIGYWYNHITDLPASPVYPMPPKTPLEDADEAEEPVANAIKAMWSKYRQEVKEIDNKYRNKKLLEDALASEGKGPSSSAFFANNHEHHEDYCFERIARL